MADASISISLPIAAKSRTNIGAITASALGSVAEFVRRRWIYQQTISELQGYSRHSLLDIGAERGIEEFARRAARL